MKISSLELLVVSECCCSLNVFWENVGQDKNKVIREAHKATTKEQLMDIINRYI